MSDNEPLGGWKLNLVVALTPWLLLISHQRKVSATNPTNLGTVERLPITLTNNRRVTKLLPEIVLTQNQLPNPIPPRTPEPPIQDFEPQPKPPVELDPAPTPTSPGLSEIPGSITVKKFEFIGNTAFSDAELRATVQEFTNRPISFAELLQAEEKIKNKYTAGCQGNTKQPCYINSGAFIPANQTFTQDGAVVKIQVIEGGIENIEITGLGKLKSGYIRSRLQRGISQPLERERLLEQLQIL
ncbi:MAG: POTRA domain-containing protein, partial [Pleurocapsa sp. MO_192.B19]|nr:POTRA domain-containing protein [Pleurocapsa sp. MO_192.B19]